MALCIFVCVCSITSWFVILWWMLVEMCVDDIDRRCLDISIQNSTRDIGWQLNQMTLFRLPLLYRVLSCTFLILFFTFRFVLSCYRHHRLQAIPTWVLFVLKWNEWSDIQFHSRIDGKLEHSIGYMRRPENKTPKSHIQICVEAIGTPTSMKLRTRRIRACLTHSLFKYCRRPACGTWNVVERIIIINNPFHRPQRHGILHSFFTSCDWNPLQRHWLVTVKRDATDNKWKSESILSTRPRGDRICPSTQLKSDKGIN